MVERMIFFNLFRKKKVLSDFFVNLSIGKVYYKKLTNKIVNSVEILSNNNVALYYTLFEYKCLDLPKKMIDNMFLDDANLVREKTKEILLHYDLINVQKPEEVFEDANIWKKQDVEWFNKNSVK